MAVRKYGRFNERLRVYPNVAYICNCQFFDAKVFYKMITNKIYPLLNRLAITYISLCVLFTLLVIGAHSIPKSWISKNLNASIALVELEGVYPEFLNDWMYRMDN